MLVTTGNEIEGHSITAYLGIVRGVVVRSPNLGQSFMGSVQGIFGGNIDAYAQACDQARQHAYDRLVEHAQQMNADAIIGMRYDATEFAQGITEVLAYGTAVKLSR
ncbi:putative conserved protein YbjQ, UPF0145 family [Abditibacterium utsteinense]|uniref:UPF0145 protein B1R32_10770 n=1 Tax=Abditibacterium utsteinense TaxID=1960156 RepID=A0A2S8STB9_9BACT|nr:YbjQ family protein [Abditibacterium utsteinense]PQV64045.1 putative conserved protein YbjQ, UPF0145 family [Abditibacterium utsteinense]